MKHLRQIILLCAFLALFSVSAYAYSPEISQGQENIVKRARQLYEIKWTPLEDIYQWDYSGVFKAGVTYSGVPYGQPVSNNGYIGWDISLEDFLDAVSDSTSEFYTSYSWYNEIAPYYSCDCSGFVSYAWQMSQRLNTTTLPNYAAKVSWQNVNAMEVGDVLNKTAYHAVLVSAIDLNTDGKVVGVEIMEQTPVITTLTGYGTLGSKSMTTFQSRYFDSGYVLYRNPNRDSVTYTYSSAVSIDGDSGSSLPFTDVSWRAWYRSAVSFVYQSSLFHGTSSSTFSPEIQMTRGMFVTVLGRLAGLSDDYSGNVGIINGTEVRLRAQANTWSTILGYFDNNTPVNILGKDGSWYKVSIQGQTGWIRGDLLRIYDGEITDLAEGQYYTNYVKWASLVGIAGANGGNFRADNCILRQDMAVMLYNYAKAYGLSLPQAGSSYFTDDSTISSYADDAVYALKSTGIISGMGDGSFNPLGNATRAQVAQIFLNFNNAGLS
ncbi:MAG: S-layer homology domain-containing protein [Oscillospiraceae bacterium]